MNVSFTAEVAAGVGDNVAAGVGSSNVAVGIGGNATLLRSSRRVFLPHGHCSAHSARLFMSLANRKQDEVLRVGHHCCHGQARQVVRV